MSRQSLTMIESEVKVCEKCPELSGSRKNTVFGDGNPEAKIVILGEAPGKDEDAKGTPFVGPAGQLLDNVLLAMGLNRSQVYICNVLKCRPPSNRTPNSEERSNCRGYLTRQLEEIKPEFLVLLGSTASQDILGKNIEACRGELHQQDGRMVLATYHPAAILWEQDQARQREKKMAVWNDLAPLREWLGRKRKEK